MKEDIRPRADDTTHKAKLIPPVIHTRQAFGTMKASFDWETGIDLSYMFDTEHLFRTLAADCPQLQFVNEDDETLNIPPKSDALVINPKKLLPGSWLGHVLTDPSQFRPTLDALIQQTATANKLSPTPASPLRLSFDDGISFSWPIAYDPPAFRDDWGHLARAPRHIRELSARILHRLYRKLSTTNATQQQDAPDRPSRGVFLGAHIRTESDAAIEGWTSFEAQAEHVRDQAVEAGLGAVYIASGTASDAARLSRLLADVGVPVAAAESGVNGTAPSEEEEGATTTTGVRVWQKWDFVDDDDLVLMDALTWDQMALIDLDVMLRASRFVGIWESSWSWAIALKRHAWSELDPYDYDAHPLTFVDEFSTLYGPTEAQPIIDPCMWL